MRASVSSPPSRKCSKISNVKRVDNTIESVYFVNLKTKSFDG